jgi:hypothetical protein
MKKDNNIVLQDMRKVHVIELPSFPKSKVEIYDGLLFGELRELESIEKDEDRGIKGILKLIKSWNFDDPEGNPLEICEDSLSLFPAKDLTVLMNKAAELAGVQEENKKKS